MISLSIVSHGHGRLVSELLADLVEIARETPLEVILTVNVPDGTGPLGLPAGLSGRIIENAVPFGFGHNHNNAFLAATGDQFCVLNPDLRMTTNPFPPLLNHLRTTGAALVAPAVFAPNGNVEDSARHFPTPWSLVQRYTAGDSGRYSVAAAGTPLAVDWIAGMFMLFSRDAFISTNGFDERFFLYCEDVDICARLRSRGGEIYICPQAAVVHDARRESRRSWRYFRWHIASYLRLFWLHPRWPAVPKTYP
ncbi:glycosyltransferase family 2 protein [Sphingomonas sp.]|uniref:glycosyltransferase family 2 protein n=1 Tax=Sphingomonas sp. TaxID=28214 RepID=UPI003CC6AD87